MEQPSAKLHFCVFKFTEQWVIGGCDSGSWRKTPTGAQSCFIGMQFLFPGLDVITITLCLCWILCLQSLFTVNPCKHPIVILKDVKFVDLKVMVDFMYYGEVNVSQEQLPHILKTAEMLKIKGAFRRNYVLIFGFSTKKVA